MGYPLLLDQGFVQAVDIPVTQHSWAEAKQRCFRMELVIRAEIWVRMRLAQEQRRFEVFPENVPSKGSR
jgi:hypothetical protein